MSQYYCFLKSLCGLGFGSKVVVGNDPMSASGQKQTFAPRHAMSALPLRADINRVKLYVGQGPKAEVTPRNRVARRRQTNHPILAPQFGVAAR